MLVLSRKANQSIMIGSDIRVMVVGVDRDQVKIGIEAPRHVPVHRLEIFAEIQRTESLVAVSSSTAPIGKAAAKPDTIGDTEEC